MEIVDRMSNGKIKSDYSNTEEGKESHADELDLRSTFSYKNSNSIKYYNGRDDLVASTERLSMVGPKKPSRSAMRAQTSRG